jgi:hypothetical protein
MIILIAEICTLNLLAYSFMDYQRQLLEELMAPFETSNKHSFWDDAICKHFLVKFCPNSLFTNTKSDLGRYYIISLDLDIGIYCYSNFLYIGPCTKIHDEKLRKQYVLFLGKFFFLITFHSFSSNGFSLGIKKHQIALNTAMRLNSMIICNHCVMT